MDQRIVDLADKYRRRSGSNDIDSQNLISNLYVKFIFKRHESIIDATSSALAIGAIFESDRIDYSKITPQMEEAYSLAFPDNEISDLSNYSPEQIEGVLSNWKGKYFEVLLRDNLNSGEAVGDILLEPGQHAELAESINQPGWDLQIVDSDGNIVEHIQAKATDSLSYIKEALEKYPDIQIVTTENSFEITDGILTAFDISNHELTDSLIDPISNTDAFDTPLENFIEGITPIIPFLVIAISEGYKYRIGKTSLKMALKKALSRSFKTGISMGTGSIVVAIDGGLLSIPASFMSRLLVERFETQGLTEKLIREASNNLTPLYKRYGME